MISRDNFALVVISLLMAGLLFLLGPLCREKEYTSPEPEKPIPAITLPAGADLK